MSFVSEFGSRRQMGVPCLVLFVPGCFIVFDPCTEHIRAPRVSLSWNSQCSSDYPFYHSLRDMNFKWGPLETAGLRKAGYHSQKVVWAHRIEIVVFGRWLQSSTEVCQVHFHIVEILSLGSSWQPLSGFKTSVVVDAWLVDSFWFGTACGFSKLLYHLEILFLLYMYGCFVRPNICVPYVCRIVHKRASKDQSYKQVGATISVLGIQPRSSGRKNSALNHQASLQPQVSNPLLVICQGSFTHQKHI